MTVLPIVLIIIYFLILFVMSVFFMKRTLNSYEEYAYCGRALTIGFIIFTYLGTWIGGGTIIGLVSISSQGGLNQYWIFALSCVISMFFAFFFLPKIRNLHLRSIGDLFALRFPGHNNIIRIPATVSVLIRNVTMIGMQFTALGYMITFTLNIDKNIAILVTFLIITTYTCLSGLWAVITTDILQGTLQIIGLILLLILSAKMNAEVNGIWEVLKIVGESYKDNLMFTNGSPLEVLAYIFCFGAFFLMGDQGDWERIYSSKSSKVAFWGYLIPLTLTLMLLLIPTISGILLGNYDGINQSEHLIYWFLLEKVTPFLGLFIMITIFSAVMSTADSYMIASGNIFANDIVKRFLHKNANEQELIFWIRLGVISAGAVGFAFAINIYDIILLWTSGIAIATIIAVPQYLMIWFSKYMNTQGALLGMITGIIYCITVLLLNQSFSIRIIIIGILFNISSSIITRAMTSAPSPDDINKTYYFRKVGEIHD